jgi:hypothetical protein
VVIIVAVYVTILWGGMEIGCGGVFGLANCLFVIYRILFKRIIITKRK